jgi:hypothetical protein
LMYPRGSKYPRGATAPIPSSSSEAAREEETLVCLSERIRNEGCNERPNENH